MCVPVQAEAALLSRRALLPVLDPRVVEHHGGGVVGLAHGGCDLIPSHLVVDLQGCQQNVPLGVDLGTTDRSAVKNGLWAEASVTDDTCAACVRPRGRRLRAGWQIAAWETESGLQNQVSCPKVKSLLTNQLKVALDGSNTHVMTAIPSHIKTNKSLRHVAKKK